MLQVLDLSHGRCGETLVPRRHEVIEKSWGRIACRHQVFLFGLRANTPGAHVVVHLKKAAAAFGRRRLFEVADEVLTRGRGH